MKNHHWWQSLAALLGYASLAAGLLLPGLRGPGCVLGNHTPDVLSFIWYMAWWLHAINHGASPLTSHYIWWPTGINLLWTTSIATPSLLLSPVTKLLGPVSAYNVAVFLSPVLLAWAAYELCREWCGKFWPALFGGFIVGFSSYEFRQLLNHLNCSMLFPIPLLAWMALRHVHHKLALRSFVAISAFLWLLLFGTSTEFFATAVMLAAVAMGVAWVLHPSLGRRLVPTAWGAVISLCIAVAAVIALVGPTLWTGYTAGRLWSAGVYSVDPLNLAVPTYTTWLGSTLLAPLWHIFAGTRSDAEQGAYLGLPLIAMAVVAWRRTAAKPSQQWLIAMLSLTLLLAMGPQLHTLNQKLPIPLPWLVISHMPVMQKALPGRLMLYVVLFLAMLMARWLSESITHPGRRITLAVVSIIFLIPNTQAGFWSTHFRTPRIFASAVSHPQGHNRHGVLIFPFGYRSWSMLWQTEAHFAFPMVDGYTGTVPGNYAHSPLVQTWLSHGPLCSHYAARLHGFLRRYHIATVIAVQPLTTRAKQLIGPLGHPTATIGHAEIFGRVPAWVAASAR